MLPYKRHFGLSWLPLSQKRTAIITITIKALMRKRTLLSWRQPASKKRFTSRKNFVHPLVDSKVKHNSEEPIIITMQIIIENKIHVSKPKNHHSEISSLTRLLPTRIPISPRHLNRAAILLMNTNLLQI